MHQIESASSETVDRLANREFRSRFYGQHNMRLLVVQSLAIWCCVILATVMALLPVFQQGKPLNVRSVGSLALVATAGSLLQWLACRASRRPDFRRVVWSPTESRLTVFEHRVTSSTFSFGAIEPAFAFELCELESAQLVKGRGRHLRVQTSRGFLSISNDIDGFEDLMQILLAS